MITYCAVYTTSWVLEILNVREIVEVFEIQTLNIGDKGRISRRTWASRIFAKWCVNGGYVTTLQELLKVKGFIMKQVFRKRSFYIVFHQKFELCDWWWEEVCDSVIRFVKLEVKLYQGVGRPKDQAKKQVRLRTTIFFNTYRIEVINIDFEARTLKSLYRTQK